MEDDSQTDIRDLRKDIGALRVEVAYLRDELKLMARAMLIVAGSKEPFAKADAEAWVEKNLGKLKK